MQKKRNTRSRVSHFFQNFVFIVICIVGASVNVYLFVQSFNQSLYKLNETPIATITFKYKTAQRKFIDRILWDRLRQDSPVYDGDTIRTAPLSEATIWFSDGNIMELYENTLAQVFFRDGTAGAELSEGDVSVDTATGSSGMKLRSGSATVNVSAGASLAAGAGNDRIKLQLFAGSAATYDIDGAVRNIDAGTEISLTSDGTIDTAVNTAPSIQIFEPIPNAKILNHSNSAQSIPVKFSWKTLNLSDASYVMLETSQHKDFSVIDEQISFSNMDSIDLQMPNGTVYYRLYPVRNASEDTGVLDAIVEPIEGRIQILDAPSPQLIAPTQDYTVSFRTKHPAVRFIWTENEWATSWELAVADNPSMSNPVIQQRTSSPSSIISSLAEGTWYWQVTPYYTVNNVGLAAPSSVQSFSITKSGTLAELSLLLPARGGVVNVKDHNGVRFSWRNEREAVSYTMKIASNTNFANPVINRRLTENYFILEDPSILTAGKQWYWTVTQTDVEGNVSPTSVPASFFAVEGELIQRTVFPPDGYAIASGRSPDTCFTWKTNVPFATRFQISTNRDFSSLYFDEVVSSSTMQGKYLSEGTWYWRIIADTESVQLSTQPKRIFVLPPLDAPQSPLPASNTRAVVRPFTPYKYSWGSVEGAEYYQLKLYHESSFEKPVFERNFIEAQELLIDMEQMKEGNYRWTIQAFSQETEYSTRRSGYLGDCIFTMKKLTPVVLKSPVHGFVIDGVKAICNPEYVQWTSVDIPAESEFYLSKNADPTVEPVMYIKNPSPILRLTRLREGTYYWVIKARTADDLDISSMVPNSFTVLPIEPLDAPTLMQPVRDTVFDATYLKKSRTVVFNWKPVVGASDYYFRIKTKDDKTLFEESIREGTEYTLIDLAVLDKGSFIWEVEAISRIEDDTILQNGILAKSPFSILLPEVKKPVFNDTGTLYGK